MENYIAINLDSFRYLCHYGTKGQKWGIRRYQNPDGSLTAAGKKRYIRQMKNFYDIKKLALMLN